jgi:hypothetical protein
MLRGLLAFACTVIGVVAAFDSRVDVVSAVIACLAIVYCSYNSEQHEALAVKVDDSSRPNRSDVQRLDKRIDASANAIRELVVAVERLDSHNAADDCCNGDPLDRAPTEIERLHLVAKVLDCATLRQVIEEIR